MESKYFNDCRPFRDIPIPVPLDSALDICSYYEKFWAKVVDSKETATINEIVRYCQDNGIGHLRLIDGEFVKQAILSACERGVCQPRGQLFKFLCPICRNRGADGYNMCQMCMLEEKAGFYPDTARIQQLFDREKELLEVKRGDAFEQENSSRIPEKNDHDAG